MSGSWFPSTSRAEKAEPDADFTVGQARGELVLKLSQGLDWLMFSAREKLFHAVE